ncbi:hypothetical protein D3C80_1314020 [compost metagenome]
MAVADHKRTVGRLHRNEMDTGAAHLAQFDVQPVTERLGFRQVRETFISSVAQVRHNGRVETYRSGGHDPEHLQRADPQIVWCYAFGIERREVVARANDAGFRLDHSSTGRDPRSVNGGNGRAPLEGHAVTLL